MTGRMTRGGGQARRSKLSPEIVAELARLQKDMGLPRDVALRVARKEVTLNQALQDMAAQDKANNLMRRLGLDRALATQVAKGQADLERVLQRRRMASHLASNADRSCLEEAFKDGQPRRFALHGQRVVTARVLNLDQYEVRLAYAEGGEEEVLHKLQFKLAWLPEQDGHARKGLRWDNALRAEPQEPVSRPQNRFGCSNRKLFGWLDEETPLLLTTLEGEVVQGQLAWFGRYELGVTVRKDVVVTVFRHALSRANENR